MTDTDKKFPAGSIVSATTFLASPDPTVATVLFSPLGSSILSLFSGKEHAMVDFYLVTGRYAAYPYSFSIVAVGGYSLQVRGAAHNIAKLINLNGVTLDIVFSHLKAKGCCTVHASPEELASAYNIKV